MIGHVNIPLTEIASDCMLNTQGHHISTYKVNPADPQSIFGYDFSLNGKSLNSFANHDMISYLT